MEYKNKDKNYKKKPFKKAFGYKKKEEKFDVDKWLKRNSNVEIPKRGKRNSLGEKK